MRPLRLCAQSNKNGVHGVLTTLHKMAQSKNNQLIMNTDNINVTPQFLNFKSQNRITEMPVFCPNEPRRTATNRQSSKTI